MQKSGMAKGDRSIKQQCEDADCGYLWWIGDFNEDCDLSVAVNIANGVHGES